MINKLVDYYKDYMALDPPDISENMNANFTSKCFNHFMIQLFNSQIKELSKRIHMEYFNEKKIAEIFWDSVSDLYLYFHDWDKMFMPYCFGMSVSLMAQVGRPYGRLQSSRPKRTDSFLAQVVEHTMDLSQQFSGAIALGDVFIEYAKFSIKEKLSNKSIENDFQKLLHVLNNEFRVGGDSAFTNISIFDRKLLKDMDNLRGLENIDDLIEEIMKVQKIYMNFIAKKDPISELPYRFPICTVNLYYDKERGFLDKKFIKYFSKVGKEGLFNIYITDEVGKVASCCRLVNDIKLMTKHLKFDSFGNGGFNLGSHRVVTLNLMKIFKEGKAWKYYVELAVKGLIAHRKLLKDLVENGFLKFFNVREVKDLTVKFIDLNRMLFSTVGYIGLYEAFDGNIDNMANFLYQLKEYSFELSEKYNIPINVEQVPAETAAAKLAEGSKYEILSNQYLPLWENYDIEERIRVAGKLDKLITGGSITHLNTGKELSEKQFLSIIEFAASKGVAHFAINPIFSKCKNNHITNGKVVKCGVCGAEIDDYYTRIVGYFTPLSKWNPERREHEFGRRKWL